LVLAQLGDVLDAASRKLEPHHICTWLFDLATTYTRFWDTCPVLKAENDSVRQSRLALCALTARALQLGMGLLGINAPERM
jgi:arginyl-tRNA synthetase